MTQRAWRRRPWLAAVALPLVAVLSALGPSVTPAHADTGASWLATINQYRASAGLPPVTENPAWTAAVASHARYVALTHLAYHDEDKASPYYSPDGAAAAKRSLIAGWWGAQRSESELVRMWIVAPFHLLHLLEPGLRQVAMGVYQEPAPAASAGVVDVFQGLDSRVKLATPIVFPGAGSTVPLTAFDGETPNPLTACPGYAEPAGLPIVAMLPAAPSGVQSSLTVDGQPVEHCTITTDSYTSGDAAEQTLVRALLKQKNAVVLVPRAPLTVGATYAVTVTSGGQPVSWRFTTADPTSAPTAAAPLPLPVATPAGARGLTATPVAPTPPAPPATAATAATGDAAKVIPAGTPRGATPVPPATPKAAVPAKAAGKPPAKAAPRKLASRTTTTRRSKAVRTTVAGRGVVVRAGAGKP